MAYQPRFNCLWCGRPHETRGTDDIEGYAKLCPDCVGRAQENEFLRFRLREGLRARSAAAEPAAGAEGDIRAYYAAIVDEYDDWYLRRGRYSEGPIADVAFKAELDQATLWLDGLDLGGEIVELAAGTGWWSPLLAQKGELWIYDAIEEPLEKARERLLAHGLRAHIHVRDAWAAPDRQVDAVFTGFWLLHVPQERLVEFFQLVRRWLKPGGTYAFIDWPPSSEGGPDDELKPDEGIGVTRLADGREYRYPLVLREPAELEQSLRGAGFTQAEVTTTGRHFLLGRATA